jgi:hypothetical protein
MANEAVALLRAGKSDAEDDAFETLSRVFELLEDFDRSAEIHQIQDRAVVREIAQRLTLTDGDDDLG